MCTCIDYYHLMWKGTIPSQNEITEFAFPQNQPRSGLKKFTEHYGKSARWFGGVVRRCSTSAPPDPVPAR